MTVEAITGGPIQVRGLSDRLLITVGVVLALLLAWLLVIYGGADGNLLAPIGVFAFLLVIPLLLRRPVVGVYLLMAAAVAVETDPHTFGLGVTDGIPLFRDVNSVTGVRGLWVNPIELIILITGAGWLLKEGAGDRINWKPTPLLLPLTAFIAVVAFGVVHGLLTGGDAKIALWTVRPLAYFYFGYVLTVQLLTDRKQVTSLVWLVLLATAVKGIIGWWRYYVDLGGDLNQLTGIDGMNSLMAHEESFFFLGIIVLAAVAFLYGAPKGQHLFAVLAVPVVLLPLLANQRRAATLALVIAFALLFLITVFLVATRRRTLLALLVLGAAVLPIYVTASWGTQSLAAEPVRAVKSGISPESRDLASNEYRDAENFNLEYTVRSSPALGIGFGKEMTTVWAMPDISEEYAWYKIAPHNTILWLMMTTGIIGFIVFWYFIGSAVLVALQSARSLAARVDKGVAIYAVLMLVALLVSALLDQGLLSMREMLFMGVLLGAALSLPRLKGDGRHLAAATKGGRSA